MRRCVRDPRQRQVRNRNDRRGQRIVGSVGPIRGETRLLCPGGTAEGTLIRLPAEEFRKSFERDREGFLRNGWLAFGLRLLLPETATGIVSRAPSFEAPKVSVEVLTDRHIRRHRKTNPFDLLGVPKSKMYIMSVHKPLEDLREKVRLSHTSGKRERLRLLQIMTDSGSDAARATTWLLPGERDPLFSTAASLDALADLDLRLGEMCGDSEPNDHPVITVFFREDYGRIPGWHRDDSVLLFGVLLVPAKRKVRYLGSVLANAETKLHTVCFAGLCSLDQKLESAECAFFLVRSDRRLSPIRAFQQTVNTVRDRCLLFGFLDSLAAERPDSRQRCRRPPAGHGRNGDRDVGRPRTR